MALLGGSRYGMYRRPPPLHDLEDVAMASLQIDSGLVGGLQIRMGLYKRHVRRNCLHPA